MDRYLLTINRAVKAGRLRITWRALAVLTVAVAVFALAGDGRVRSASTTLPQDPLELLNLQVKANAFIILDTSGSMGDEQASTANADRWSSDDYTYGKMHQAKTVLNDIIAKNKDTVAFSFGTYSQVTSLSLATTGTNRFVYFTTSTDPASTDLVSHDFGINASTSSTPRVPVHRGTGDSFTDAATPGVTHYRLAADGFVNGVIYTVHLDGSVCNVDTTTMPASKPPQVKLIQVNSNSNCTATPQYSAVYTFAGAAAGSTPSYGWEGATSASCQGYGPRIGLLPCTQTDPLGSGGIGNYLKDDLLMTADGKNIDGYAQNATTFAVTSQPTYYGLKAAGYTPLANALIDLKGYWEALWTGTIAPEIAAGSGVQSTFAIILTDGDDTCATRTSNNGVGNAYRAAYAAQALYKDTSLNPLPDFTSSVSHFKTFVVFFGPKSNASKSNWIAWGGTGMSFSGTGLSGSGEATQWVSAPADASACPTCHDAFTALNTADLTAALQAAIDLGQNGAFSDRAVISNVYEELKGDALDPNKRYATAVPVLFQATWDIPGFNGHLNAYTSASGTTSTWDAGDKLLASVGTGLSATTPATFADLTGGYTDANINSASSTSAVIKRRIYTSSGNGSLGASNYTAQNLVNQATSTTAAASLGANRVALWPPDSSVNPAEGTAGKFDYALGLLNPPYGYSLSDLQTKLGACQAASTFTWPSTNNCRSAATAQQQSDAAVKEAREMILAHMAGADVSKTSGVPNRDTTTGNVKYVPSSWILAESTNASPAVVTPPPQLTAMAHSDEWNLFVSGPSSGTKETVLAGFGLKLPDTTTTMSNNDLKPVMTVVYLPANDMLHALRAGPCPGGSCGTETGGEELWGFVPYDQLIKLTRRLIAPGLSTVDRANHNYMMAASVRLAHVFVPAGSLATDTWTSGSLSGHGVWRTVLLAGRGAGGKYLTALDVTVPGPTTTAHLSTKPPIVMWNRGNGDGVGGTNDYAGMGQTWSVPAVGPVDPSASGLGKEFVAFVGSGYSDVSGEGTKFYAIDVLNGTILGASLGLPYNADNFIAASPSLFQPKLLTFSTDIPLAATDVATVVYFADLYGRIYRWDLTKTAGSSNPALFKDYGTAQPIGVAMMLLNIKDHVEATSTAKLKPHVFAESGADDRVPTTSNFEIFGLRDDSTTTVTSGEVFTPLQFPSGYRGTVQPVGVFDVSGDAIAMFVATKYTAASDVTGSYKCVSQFDSVLYMLEAGRSDATAGSGTAGNAVAAYDLPGGGNYLSIPKQKVTDLGMAGGMPRLAGGLKPEVPSPPPTQKGTRQPPSSVSIGPPPLMSPLAGTTSFKFGSSLTQAASVCP